LVADYLHVKQASECRPDCRHSLAPVLNHLELAALIPDGFQIGRSF